MGDVAKRRKQRDERGKEFRFVGTHKDDRYVEKKDAIIKKAKNGACLDCGRFDLYYLMDFDHRDPSQKKFNIGSGTTSCCTIQSLLEEIAKCDLLCVRCHRIRTHERKHYLANNADHIQRDAPER